MNYIRLTHENLESEHICCAISNNNDPQVRSKKDWLSERLDEGLVFLKGDVRGKCFIEYIPAENAWVPIDAEGYMFIDCFWVSGQFKGNGYSNDLLEECINDSKAKGRKGLCIISSEKKKMPFLSDPKYLAYKGFRLADTAKPYFTLMYLPFEENAPAPKFRECAKNPQLDAKGFTLFYTAQCPFTAKYVPLLEKIAKDRNVQFEAARFTYAQQAQVSPAIFSPFSLFYNGEFVTHEILSDKKFIAILEKLI